MTSKALTAVQTAQVASTEPTLRDYVLSKRGELESRLGSLMPVDNFLGMAITAIYDPSNRLHECHPASVVHGLLRAAELGLSVASVTGEAYLIPRKVQGKQLATFQMGYPGYVKIAARNGIRIDAREVRADDYFDYAFGTDAHLTHRPSLDSDDSPIVAFYAVATQPGMSPLFEVRSLGWMEKHRERFAARKGDNAPWWEHFEAMARKTMVRRLATLLPRTADMAKALEYDDEPHKAEHLEPEPLPAIEASTDETEA